MDLPADIRHEFIVSAATQIKRQGRWLFLVFLALIPLAIMIARPEAHWLLRWALPLAMTLYSCAGFWQLSRQLDFESNPQCAVRFVRISAVVSCIGAAICCAWALGSWFGAQGSERLQYPVIVVMSALASAYCLSSVRLGAILNIGIAVFPIALALIFFGSALDRAVGITFVLAGVFQWRMINAHHRQVIALLRLQRQSQKLALTDALTNLLNRRALQNFIEELAEGGAPSRVMLVDIDHFKSINDTFGHDSGDRVLEEFARVLEDFAGHDAVAARIGGEEFALVGTQEALPRETAEALLERIRTTRFSHGQTMTASIGIATGPLGSTEQWRDLHARADKALYRAKRSGRDRWVVDGDGEVPARAASESMPTPANEAGPEPKVA